MIVDIELKDNGYKVIIDELDKIELKGKVAIITNAKVGGLWLGDVMSRVKCDELAIISVPDGEEFKNFESVAGILKQLFVSKFDRKSTLIALGGGVISDMTGFVASIYQRGINFINIPTTLLAQVDASVGGKTGINNEFGKNLIGTFYQPKAVYCESKFLETLPAREFAAGMAEAIKMAATLNKELFEYLESRDIKSDDEIKNVIAKCVMAKAKTIISDEKESGIRMVLNYGHTFAHVIERETDYKRYLHGEAVAMGMMMANSLSLRLGYISSEEFTRIERLLHKFSLPTRYKIKDIDSFYDAFFLDKKSSYNTIKFVLPFGIGNAKIDDKVPQNIVKSVLGEYA